MLITTFCFYCRCQVFHICSNGKTYDFLCPNGTIFHQEFLVCVWWNLFDCSLAQSFYGVNANLYVSQQQSENTPNSGSSTNPFENQGITETLLELCNYYITIGLGGIKDDSPTPPGYGSTSPNNPENNGGYYSGEPAQSQGNSVFLVCYLHIFINQTCFCNSL